MPLTGAETYPRVVVTTVRDQQTHPAVEPEEIRSQLARMLDDEVFRTSPRLSAFLRHVVERKLEGKTDDLGEFAIAHEVFGRDASFDSRIDSIVRVSARKLRAKLVSYYEGAGSSDPIRILLPTPGYVPAFEVNRAAVPSATASGNRAIRTRAAAVSAMAFVIAVVAGILVWIRPDTPSPASTAIVAVLPLRTLPSNAADGTFAEAMTAEIVAQLAQAEGISVLVPKESLDFEQSAEMSVDYLLEGVVVQSRDRLRLTAHITAAASQHLSWGDSFEAAVTDPIDAQRGLAQELSRAVVESLTGTPPPREGGPSTVPGAYVLGKASMNRWTEPAMQRSAESFARAIEEDPDFAPAYASHAMALRILSFMSSNPDHDRLARARASAERALELDPDLAEAHASLGGSEVFEHDWQEAERHFRRALEIDPDHATAHHMYGMLSLAATGRLEEAERELRRATALQPLSLWSHLGLVPILYFREKYDEALDQLESTGELAPGIPILDRFRGQVLIASGEPSSAIEELTRAWERTADPVDLGLLAHARAAAGETDEARRLVRRLEDAFDAGTRSQWSLAVALVGLGDDAAALEHLRAACERREVWALYAAVDPIFRDLRSLSGFRKIRAALNLHVD